MKCTFSLLSMLDDLTPYIEDEGERNEYLRENPLQEAG